MNSYLILFLSCALIISEASFATKHMRDPGEAQAQGPTKKPRQENAPDLQALKMLTYQDPQRVIDTPHLREAVLEMVYEQCVLTVSGGFATRVIKAAKKWKELSFAHDSALWLMAHKQNMVYSLRPETITSLQRETLKGNVHARHMLANVYFCGHIDVSGGTFAPDQAKAFALYQEGALQGHAPSQTSLGIMHAMSWADTDGVIHKPDITTALSWYEKAVDQGDTVAQAKLAMIYLKKSKDGEGIYIDKALSLLSIAANTGYAPAQYELARLYSDSWTDTDGINHAPDQDRAHALFCQAAENGFIPAQKVILHRYLKGWVGSDGTSHAKNTDKAFEHLLTWAKDGFDFAQNYLAELYLNGKHSEKKPNLEQAYYWYHRAAKQGNLSAKTQEALLCLNQWHHIGEKEPLFYKSRAFTLLTEASDKGWNAAKYPLACLYMKTWTDKDGVEHPQDIDKAQQLLMDAALKADMSAQETLLNWCRNGVEWTNGAVCMPNKYSEYILLLSWANAGHAHAQFELACLCMKGLGGPAGIPEDFPWPEQAYYWLNEASNKGYAKAHTKLALMCFEPWHGLDDTVYPAEPERGFNLLSQGADKNDLDALYELANMYAHDWFKEYGLPYDTDVTHAKTLYAKAADQGHAPSQYELGELLLLNDSGDEPDLPRAMAYLTKAADQGNANAQYRLGTLYAHDLALYETDISLDREKALHYLLAAASQHQDDARRYLRKKFDTHNIPQMSSNEPFSVTPVLIEKFNEALYQVPLLMGITNPETHHLESVPSRALHGKLGLILDDLTALSHYSFFIVKAGFMMKNLRETFKADIQEHGRPENASFSIFHHQKMEYLCVGRENVAAAKILLPLLDKIQEHPSVQACQMYFDVLKETGQVDDLEEHEKVVQFFKDLDQIFKDASLELQRGIKDYGSARARAFVDEYLDK